MEQNMQIERRDMDMYYNGTILPVAHPTIVGRKAGVVIQSIEESRTGNYLDYSVIGKVCTVRDNGDIRTDLQRINFRDFLSDGLMKAHQPVGFIKLNSIDNPVWVTTRPALSYKKGLNHGRMICYNLRNQVDLTDFSLETLAARIYHPFEGRLSDDFCLRGIHLMYKDRLAGKIVEGQLRLFSKFFYLKDAVSSIVGYEVTISHE